MNFPIFLKFSDIFKKIDVLDLDTELDKLQGISDELWSENFYEKNEPDRVVLNVSMKATKNKTTQYEKSYLLDAWGNERGTAMARLVSLPVALAVEAIMKNEIAPGVSAAPKSPEIVKDWLKQVGDEAQILRLIDNS